MGNSDGCEQKLLGNLWQGKRIKVTLVRKEGSTRFDELTRAICAPAGTRQLETLQTELFTGTFHHTRAYW